MANVIISIITFCSGLWIGHKIYIIEKALNNLKSALLEKPQANASVTFSNPELIKENKSTSVVYPKTPQQVDFEEQEAIRRLNPGS